MYNLTNITDNSNNIYDVIKATNDLSGGILISLLMLVLFVVYLVVFKKESFKVVFLSGSFLMSVLGGLLYTLGLIGGDFLIAPIVVLLIGVFIYIFAPD